MKSRVIINAELVVAKHQSQQPRKTLGLMSLLTILENPNPLGSVAVALCIRYSNSLYSEGIFNAFLVEKRTVTSLCGFVPLIARVR